MSHPFFKRRVTRIAFGTVVGLLVLLLAYSLYSNYREGPLFSDVPAPSLRAILSGIVEYKRTYKTYPPTLAALGGTPASCARDRDATAAAACLIDDVLASGEKSGYSYRYKAIDTLGNGSFDAFTVNADPLGADQTRQLHYFTDQTGVIRVETGRPATAASPPIH
jgi:hypothetical protein